MTSSEFLSSQFQSIHIRVFKTEDSKNDALLIHGSLEDGRIFYSNSDKGLAPYMQSVGYNVFVPDFQGRGKSRPHPKDITQGHDDIILDDIPILIDKVFSKNQRPITIICHSWGGVLLLGALARKPELCKQIRAIVFFGTKRHISIRSFRRLFFVDILWAGLGSILTSIYGYLPAKKLKFGSEDETFNTFMGTRDLVYKKRWVGKDHFDYASKLIEMEKPPALFFAGIKDYYLGHPKDVVRLIEESDYKNAEIRILSKHHGASLNYGHINMLTSPNAKEDVFEPMMSWLQGI